MACRRLNVEEYNALLQEIQQGKIKEFGSTDACNNTCCLGTPCCMYSETIGVVAEAVDDGWIATPTGAGSTLFRKPVPCSSPNQSTLTWREIANQENTQTYPVSLSPGGVCCKGECALNCPPCSCRNIVSYALKFNSTEEECRNAGGSFFQDGTCGFPSTPQCYVEGTPINGITPDFYGYRDPKPQCSGQCDCTNPLCVQDGCECCPAE